MGISSSNCRYKDTCLGRDRYCGQFFARGRRWRLNRGRFLGDLRMLASASLSYIMIIGIPGPPQGEEATPLTPEGMAPGSHEPKWYP